VPEPVAVVTGGASGIGRALVEESRQRGARVLWGDRAVDPASPPPDSRHLDVSDRADVDRFAAWVGAEVDGVDLLVNNAGVMPTATVAETTPAMWAAALGVNLLGLVHVVQAFLPALRAQARPARIVNIASLAGFAPPVGGRCGAYAATKSAVISVSESLADELAGSGISVSVVCPSGVETGIFGGPPPAGLMAPAEAARRILDGVAAGRSYVFTHVDEAASERLFGRWARVEADFIAAAATM
jgi:NAD(P)-dependent dehydrogenase (short-subunit alcohol dehydrogenase family)